MTKGRAPAPVKDTGRVTADTVQDKRKTPTTDKGKRPIQQSRDRRPSQSRDNERRPYSQDGGDRRRSPPRDRRSRDFDRRPPAPQIPDELMEFVKEIDGKESQEGIFLNDKQKQVKKVTVEKLFDEVSNAKSSVAAIIFDGIITQRLIDVCEEKNIETLIGARIAELQKRPEKVKIYSFA